MKDYRFGQESPSMRMTSFPSKIMSIDNVAYSLNMSLYMNPVHRQMST